MSSFLSRPRAAVMVGAVAVALLAVPALASAASGPTLLSPNKGAVVPVNTAPTFTVRDRSSQARKYKVWITVSSVKKVKRGELQKDSEHGYFSDMRRKKNGKYAVTPKLYSFPDYFLARPGKYWWQAHHIDCGAKQKSCSIVSKIRSFTVQ